MIYLGMKDTRTPSVGIGGSLDFYKEAELRRIGAAYCSRRRRKDGDEFYSGSVRGRVSERWLSRTHYSVPAPLLSRLFNDNDSKPVEFMQDWRNHIDDWYPETELEDPPARLREFKIEREVAEFYQRWKLYEEDLGRIKRNDMEVIRRVLRDHGIDGKFFAREPKPHQEAGVAFFLRSMDIGSGHVCFFDEMRTGKTKQAIDIARYLLGRGIINRVLVLCPNSIKRVWLDEIRIDAPEYGLFSTIIQGSKSQKEALWNSRFLFYIANYECARADEEYLRRWVRDINNSGWLLICDEAHKLKNPQAKQTRVVIGLYPDYSVMMTGTPIANRPEDAFSMADFVCPQVLGESLDTFQWEFGIRGGYKGKQIVGYRNLDEVKYRLARISVRRLRKDVVFDQVIRTPRYGQLAGDQKKVYEDMRDFLWAELTNSSGEWTAVQCQNHLVQILRLQQITSGYLPKVDLDNMQRGLPLQRTNESNVQEVVWFDSNWKLAELDELVDEYLEEMGKLVIWSRFVPPIELLVKRYEKHGAVKIRGQMGDTATDNMYRFQRDPDCRIMIAQIQTSEGRGFQPATVCLFWDKWWSPHLNRQAEDRIVGIKNPVPVTVMTLITEESIDDRLELILEKKREWADAITGDTNEDVKLPHLGKTELMYLLAKPEDAERLKGGIE